jgi:NADPH2:quinone reductase
MAASAIPTKMTAIVIERPGGPEVLRPAEIDTPQPGPGQILVEVAAAGVNRPDAIQRQGLYPPPPGAPEWPGLEVCGTIVALGPDVKQRRLGERVMALVAGGGYATYCVVDEPLAIPVPDALSDAEAAGIPETFFTVWVNVFMRGRLKVGESILIHGGSSGIGTTAIQLCKVFGARVFTTAGTEAKVEACRKLGVDCAINYREEDFVQRVKAETGGRGVDVVLDMVGGAYIPKNISLLADSGRHLSIAFLGGPKAEVNFAPVMRNRLTLTGSTLRPRTVAEKAEIAEELKEHVMPFLISRRVQVVLDSTYPLASASEAHARLESDHIGKIVLTAG